jgi:hypothetical protein
MCGRENSGRRTVKNRDEKSVQNKGSGQLIHEPVMRAFAVDSRRFVLFLLAAAKVFSVIVGVPFSDVSFRAFTASPTVEKGTPTAQLFDNRSIAQLLSDLEICS